MKDVGGEMLVLSSIAGTLLLVIRNILMSTPNSAEMPDSRFHNAVVIPTNLTFHSGVEGN